MSIQARLCSHILLQLWTFKLVYAIPTSYSCEHSNSSCRTPVLGLTFSSQSDKKKSKSYCCYFSELAPGHFYRHQGEEYTIFLLDSYLGPEASSRGFIKEKLSPLKGAYPWELTTPVVSITLVQNFGQSSQIILYHGQGRELWNFTEFMV